MMLSNPARHTLIRTSVLKPTLRAYIFAHASSTGPVLFSFLLTIRKRRLSTRQVLERLIDIFLSSLDYNRFPAFCATLVGGYTLLQDPFRFLLRRICTHRSRLQTLDPFCVATSRFLAAFFASWLSLYLLNISNIAKKSENTSNQSAATEAEPEKQTPNGDVNHEKLLVPGHRPPLAGKTLDLTLLVSVRALETFLGDLWSRHARPKSRNSKWSPLYLTISQSIDPAVFAVSAGAVMWAWFYLPDRLPRAYNKWIGEAAQVDRRLVEALRKARWGEFVYGKDTGQAPALQSMCRDYNWPLVWGDPSKTIPIPCEMVHMGTGPSCHWHIVVRFARAFKFSFAMYLPLQLLVRIGNPSMKTFKQAVRAAIRSSTFLSAFISMFYYAVCLSRTLLGPKLFSKDRITPMMWDSGLCVGAGCMLCGWSILIEAAKRRQEFAFFVAPRAAATLLPRRYEKKYFWREQIAFSLSTGLLFAYVQSNPAKVRGVLGQALHGVLS